MKPAPFAYERPEDVGAAVALLAEREGAVALAGGQSLMPALNLRERRAGLLVDLGALLPLRTIEEAGGVLRIGAGARMWDVERDPLVAEHAPLLVETLRTVGAPSIRSRATLGGSLAWADPTSQVPATLLALRAVVVTDRRRLPVEELLTGPHATALERGELIVTVELRRGDGRGALRLLRRTGITWPVAGAAVVRGPGETRVALFGAGAVAVAGDGASADEACAAALAKAEPFTDARAGAGYRRAVLPVLAARALQAAGG